MIDWKSKFDHIYCIHYLPKHEERFGRIESELKRVGILDSGIFSWKFTVDQPRYKYIQDNVNVRHPTMRQQVGMFNCAYAHYELYKESFYMNYKRILVFEEDASFLKNVNAIQQILNFMPDTDIVLFDKFVYNPYEYQKNLSDNKYYINEIYRKFDKNCTHYGSTAGYSINDRAIRIYIRQQENVMYNPDEIWNDWGDNVEANQLTKSFSINNMCYQKSFADSVHNNIELAYKFINLNKENYQ